MKSSNTGENAEFSRLLAEARAQGRMTAQLVGAIKSYCRAKLDLPAHDADDVISAVLGRFAKKWTSLQPDQNPLAYVGSMLFWEKKSFYRRNSRRRELIVYEAELGDRFGRGQTLEECSPRNVLAAYC